MFVTPSKTLTLVYEILFSICEIACEIFVKVGMSAQKHGIIYISSYISYLLFTWFQDLTFSNGENNPASMMLSEAIKSEMLHQSKELCCVSVS